MEEWRPIPYFPNYECSNTGLIRRALNQRVLKLGIMETARDYLVISIYYNKKKYTKNIGRLIYDSFNECECKQTIDHIDRNPKNNHISAFISLGVGLNPHPGSNQNLVISHDVIFDFQCMFLQSAIRL